MPETIIRDLFLVAPELLLVVSILMLVVYGAFRGNQAMDMIFTLGAIVLGITIFLVAITYPEPVRSGFNGMLFTSPFTAVMKIILLAGTLGVFIVSRFYLHLERLNRFEYPLLILLSVVGMMLMVSAQDLLTLYMAFELQSLSLYVLAAFARDRVLSSEAGLKYFLLGALSSGMFLFGVSLIYGNVGHIQYDIITNVLGGSNPEQALGAVIGLIFVICAIAFKISAVPFHMWTPDVYHGAPLSVTAYFATVPKIAAVAALTNLLMGPFMVAVLDWSFVLQILAAASILWGGLAGLIQISLKRLIAYSSINNMGFVLLALAAASPEGVSAMMVYFLLYVLMSLGLFATLLALRQKEGELDRIADLAGLSRRYPYHAGIMGILLFSFAGIPPLAGFFAKFVVIKAAITSGLYAVAVVAIIGSVIAAYYYLRIIKIMYMDPANEHAANVGGWSHKVLMGISAVALIGFILVPQFFVTLANTAAKTLFFG